jgi:hypothetical protein
MTNEDQLAKFTTFIVNNTWIFAKTYAATAPHEYLVKRNLSPVDQEILVEFAYFIKENGYKKLFGSMEFTYFDIGDWMYWTMDEDVSKTDLINRAKK